MGKRKNGTRGISEKEKEVGKEEEVGKRNQQEKGKSGKEEEVEKYFRFLPAMQSEVSMLRKCLKDKKIPIPASKLKNNKYTF